MAVDDLDLEIGKGECFGLSGPNGTGKATLIRMINAVSPPTAGEIRIPAGSPDVCGAYHQSTGDGRVLLCTPADAGYYHLDIRCFLLYTQPCLLSQ